MEAKELSFLLYKTHRDWKEVHSEVYIYKLASSSLEMSILKM